MSANPPWIDALTDLGSFLKHNSWALPQPGTSDKYDHYTDIEDWQKVGTLADEALEAMRTAGLRAPLPGSEPPLTPIEYAYTVLMELSEV